MQYLLTRIEKDGSTPTTSTEWTSIYPTFDGAIAKIHSTNNWCAKIQFCPEGWRKTYNGMKPKGEVYTVYEYNRED